jgi:hypothetical protein
VLREFVYVKQERHGGRRRWFESDGLELVVWQDAAGALEGFQLCYDLGRGEHALTWRPGAGFVHSAVDSGDNFEGAAVKQTPILVPDGAVPWRELAARFAERSGTIEAQLRELVSTRLAAKK